MEEISKWAIFYKGKVIPIRDETIQWIRQDPTEIWGWFDLELMLSSKFKCASLGKFSDRGRNGVDPACDNSEEDSAR